MTCRIEYSDEAHEAAESTLRGMIGWNFTVYMNGTPADYKLVDVTRDSVDGFCYVHLHGIGQDGFIIDGMPVLHVDAYKPTMRMVVI